MGNMTPQDAQRIIHQAWQAVHGRAPTSDEAAYAQAIAFLETRYGRAGQFGQFVADGLGYNWGAQERGRLSDGSCPAGTVEGTDAGNARCFYVWPSDVEAAKAFIRNLTVSFPTRAASILDAMNGGTPEDVAEAMRQAPAYFEASADQYAAGIRNALSAMRSANIPTPSARARGLSFFTLLALGGGLYAFRSVRPDLWRKIPIAGRY